jgi:hypothetical protein
VTNWSTFLGEEIISSLTAAPDIEGYQTGGDLVSGTYIVASRTLAQSFTEEEAITNALHNASYSLFPNLDDNGEAGPLEDLKHPHLSGKMQAWRDCRGLRITNFLAAATPDGRDCMVFVHVKMAGKADQDVKDHIFDSVDVDCEGVARVGEPGAGEVARVSVAG